MTKSSLTKTFTHHGSYVHEGPLESGSTIIVRDGDCTINGPVGDDVVLEVGGSVSLLSDAGDRLHVMAGADFYAANIGQSADITAMGEASAATMGYGSWLRGKTGVGITSKEANCGDHAINVSDGFVALGRKWPSQEGENVCAIDFKPPSPVQ